MPKILDVYKPQIENEQALMSEKSKEFVRLTMLHEKLEKEKESLFSELSESEKRDAFDALKQKYNIPDYIMVKDAAEILGITPQMVRRHCSDGKLKSHQTLIGSGKWRIETEQFMGYPNWDNFIEKRAAIKKQSINIANKMLEYLDDVE